MKTDELINAMVADAQASEPPIGRTVAIAVAAGAVVAAVLFAATIGVRANLGYLVMHSWQIALKFVFTLAIAVPAVLIVRNLSRPDGDAGTIAPWLVLPAAAVLAAMAYELTGDGAVSAAGLVFHPNWSKCVVLIPMLSVAPLGAALYALKQGAPANPALAGAAGGLLSGAIGATLYAMHCNADSSLFVGFWYSLAIIAMAAIGGVIGSKLLRW